MEDVTFNVVEIDGVLADIRPVFNGLATAVLNRPIEAHDWAPPHTIARLCQAAGLLDKEIEEVRATIREIRDFWVSVPTLISPWRPVPLARLVFHACRLQTRGEPVLLQTIDWLTKLGYKNPIVWLEEEE